MLELTQHPTSNSYKAIAEKQHGTGTKTDMKNSGTEQRSQT
jgi:hypothetical protein